MKMFRKYELAVWLSIQNLYSHFTKVTRKCECFGRIVKPCVTDKRHKHHFMKSCWTHISITPQKCLFFDEVQFVYFNFTVPLVESTHFGMLFKKQTSIGSESLGSIHASERIKYCNTSVHWWIVTILIFIPETHSAY